MSLKSPAICIIVSKNFFGKKWVYASIRMSVSVRSLCACARVVWPCDRWARRHGRCVSGSLRCCPSRPPRPLCCAKGRRGRGFRLAEDCANLRETDRHREASAATLHVASSISKLDRKIGKGASATRRAGNASNEEAMNRFGTALRALMGAITLGLALTSTTLAQTWPQRPVRFILPLGPGSGVDIAARLLADRLLPRWGQSVVVENRPGGDGILAITTFIGAHDDHVLLFSPTSSFTAHPFSHDKLPYDARDLSPIARVANTIVVVTVPTSLNIGTVKDLMDYARNNPGKLNWTTATGVTDVIADGFVKSSGLAMTRVPYRDTVQALNDLG